MIFLCLTPTGSNREVFADILRSSSERKCLKILNLVSPPLFRKTGNGFLHLSFSLQDVIIFIPLFGILFSAFLANATVTGAV